MNRLFIIGAGGIGRLFAQIVQDINRNKKIWNLIGFIDDDQSLWGKKIGGIQVLGGMEKLNIASECHLLLGFSNSQQKQKVVSKLAGTFPFATLIHPKAWVADRVEIGEGSVIYPGVCIDVDVTAGRHCLLNKNVTIGHDTIIGDFTSIAPGVNIGGSVRIGIGCEFGINSATVQNVNIGDHAKIGAGACVISDISAKCTAVGVPAKPIRFHD